MVKKSFTIGIAVMANTDKYSDILNRGYTIKSTLSDLQHKQDLYKNSNCSYSLGLAEISLGDFNYSLLQYQNGNLEYNFCDYDGIPMSAKNTLSHAVYWIDELLTNKYNECTDSASVASIAQEIKALDRDFKI